MRPLYRFYWLLFRSVFTLYFRWRVHGENHIPQSGPVILASNHASFLDPPLVGSAARREASYLARESLFRVPLLGALIRSINALPVDREGKSPRGLKSIVARLAEGKPVVLFPEGTRSLDGCLLPARSGVGLAVAKSGAPVVPVRVFGSFEAYSRKMWLPRPRKISVVFGQPIRFDETIEAARAQGKARMKAVYPEISERIMASIASLELPKS